MFQRINLAIPPPVEPITVDDAKAFLRIAASMSLDDALILSLITAARQYCENLVRRTFIATGWDVTFDAFPGGGGYYSREIRASGEGPGWLPSTGGVFDLPKSPVISVDWIKYFDTANTLVLIDPAAYVVSLGFPARVQSSYGTAWPIPAPRIDAVQIRITSGYGPDAAAVPETVKTAIRLAVTHLYENRGDQAAPMPQAVCDILSPDDTGVIL